MTKRISASDKTSILVVDDTVNNLRLLTHILQEQGYVVRAATNGSLALMSIEAELPDLVLLDVHMPGLDGYAVCRKLKENPKTAVIPIIFLSASEDAWDKKQAFLVGGVDYISKPIQVEEVVARVHTQIALRRAEAQVADQARELETLRARLAAAQSDGASE